MKSWALSHNTQYIQEFNISVLSIVLREVKLIIIANIDELGKSALGMVELLHETRAEHTGIHSNPESGNHLVNTC